MMKKTIAGRLVLTAGLVAMILFAGCGKKAAQNKAMAQSTKKQAVGVQTKRQGVVPESLGVSQDTLKARIKAEKKKQTQAGEKKHILEALEAISETQSAVDAIKKNDTQAAIDTLAKAVGKLELVLARYPNDSLILADSYVQTFSLMTNLKSAKWAHKRVKKLVADDDLQDARRLLDNMGSEIRITYVYIPMKTYPDAIKEAARLLDNGKSKEAQRVLERALNTLVIEERSIPIPLIDAMALTDAASQIADSSKTKALELLNNAHTQLLLAKELGYRPHEKIYKRLNKEIKELESKLKKGEKTKGVFDRLKADLKELKSKF